MWRMMSVPHAYHVVYVSLNWNCIRLEKLGWEYRLSIRVALDMSNHCDRSHIRTSQMLWNKEEVSTKVKKLGIMTIWAIRLNTGEWQVHYLWQIYQKNLDTVDECSSATKEMAVTVATKAVVVVGWQEVANTRCGVVMYHIPVVAEFKLCGHWCHI